MTTLEWPVAALTPSSTSFDPRAFSRSGGRSLGGVSRSIKTDRGYWVGKFGGILFRRNDFGQRRLWSAVRTQLNGTTGLIIVPICSTPLLVGLGATEFFPSVPHDDDTSFDDGTTYSQPGVVVKMASFAALGATVVTLRNVVGASSLSGIRFSYRHALYETGVPLSAVGDVWQVPVFPAIRRAIPDGAVLELAKPTCLCNLATDNEMDIDFPAGSMPRPDVNFVEAVDHWNDLAIEDAA